MRTEHNVKPRILVHVTEGEKLLLEYLSKYGYELIVSDDISSAITACESYDMAIFSHYRNGVYHDWRWLRQLRDTDKKIPCLIVSSLNRYEHIIEAFDEGADDYVVAPFNLEELVRRIDAIVRRCGVKNRAVESVHRFREYEYIAKTGALLRNGEEIARFGSKRAVIMALMCAYRGQVVPRDTMLMRVWGGVNKYLQSTLTVHLSCIRDVFKGDPNISITNDGNGGYKLEVNENHTKQ